MRRRALALATVALTMLAACGGNGDAREAAPGPSTRALPTGSLSELVGVLGPHDDYRPAASPRALLKRQDVAVEGTIASVENGRTQMADFGAGVQTVVFGVAVTEEFKADPQRAGEHLYFEMIRPENVDASVYRDSIGIGTQVIFLGYRSRAVEPVRDEYAGREAGASVYQASPQGLFVLEPVDDTATGTPDGASDQVGRRVAGGVTVDPVLEEVEALPEAWQDLSATEIRSDLRALG
ncbi:hypothetical protein ACJ5H2_20840 [Nocardioides sp. R1-1]|uniref:hypothetical protein n=1 Tax=Nocardioides sp. R1-1 TaxID=3383502 RepID=UPI0038D01162